MTEKWDVAFYVVSLAFKDSNLKKTKEVKPEIMEKAQKIISWSLLASLSNLELENYLSEKLSTSVKREEIKSLVAQLRKAQFKGKEIPLNKVFNISMKKNRE